MTVFASTRALVMTVGDGNRRVRSEKKKSILFSVGISNNH